MSIRRFLYQSIFNVVQPAVVLVAGPSLSSDMVITTTNVPFQSEFAVPTQPPVVSGVFSQWTERPSVGRGLPEAVMQDGSDTAPTPPPPPPASPVFMQWTERPSISRGLPVALMQDGSDGTPIGPSVAVRTLASPLDPIVTVTTTVIADNPVPPLPPTLPITPSSATEPAIIRYPMVGTALESSTLFVPPTQVTVFAQSPERPSIGRGLPEALMQDGSDSAPFAPPVQIAAISSLDAPVIFNRVVIYDGVFSVPTPVPLIFNFSQSPDLFRKPIFLQQRFGDFAPAGSISVTPSVTQGSYVQDPALFVKPYRVSLQRFGDFTPAGTIVSITPQGWWGQPPALFAKPYPISLQRLGELAPFAPTAAPVSIASGSEPFVVQASFVVADSPLPPIPPVAAVTAQYGAFPQYPDIFVKPLPAKLQWQGPDFPPQTIVSATPQGWWGQPPALFAKPVAASLQAKSGDFVFAPPAAVQGWWGQQPALFAKPVAASLQRFGDAAPFRPVVFVSVAFTESPPQLAKYPATVARLQRFSSDTFATFYVFPISAYAISTAPISGARIDSGQGGAPSISATFFGRLEERFVKPFNVTLQQFTGWQTPGFITQPTPITVGNYFQWPERYAPRLAVTQQRFNDLAPFTPVTAVVQPFSQSPDRFAQQLPASIQRFQDFAPAGVLFVPTPVTMGAFIQWPDRFAVPFKATQQRFGDFAPLGTVVSVTPQGWWGQSPALFAKPVPAAVQPFEAAQPLQSIVSVTPQGWMFQSPERFGKRFPVALQRFQDFAPAGFIFVTTTPTTPAWTEWPPRFVRPLSASLQRFGSDLPFGPPLLVFPISAYPISTAPISGARIDAGQPRVLTTTSVWWAQSPALFIKGAPASIQRFQDFAPPPRAVTAPTPPFALFQPPVIFGKPFPVADQRFQDFAPLGFIFVPTPVAIGDYYQMPALLVPRFPAQLQQFDGWQTLGFIFQPTPITQGAYTPFPERYIKRFPVHEQQLQGWTPRGFILQPTPVTVGDYSQLPTTRIKPLPVTLQVFSNWSPFLPPITPVAPPGQGEMIKNDVERTRWLANSQVRVRWILNDVIRKRDLN